jgi:hypothetical protein
MTTENSINNQESYNGDENDNKDGSNHKDQTKFHKKNIYTYLSYSPGTPSESSDLGSGLTCFVAV